MVFQTDLNVHSQIFLVINHSIKYIHTPIEVRLHKVMDHGSWVVNRLRSSKCQILPCIEITILM